MRQPDEYPKGLLELLTHPDRDKMLASLFEVKKAIENAVVIKDGIKYPLRFSAQNAVVDLDSPVNEASTGTVLPPVLALEVDDVDDELDITITLVDDYDQIYLERGTDGISFAALVTLAGNVTTYSDDTVTPGTEYFYRARGKRNDVYSVYSNTVSGEVTAAACSYSLPGDMGSSTLFFQGFEAGDISDPPWTPPFPVTIPGGGTVGGYGFQAGNLSMSENGRVVIVTVENGPNKEVRVVERLDDNSFTVDVLNVGGGANTAGYLYNISRNGIIAGRIGSQGAVWLSGPTSGATTDASIRAWYRISQDGTKLYGINTSDEAIERTIGGADVVIATGCESISGVSHCGDVVVVDTNSGSTPLQVYKKVAGVWGLTATLADHTGNAAAFPLCCNITGDGTKAFGSNDDTGASARVYTWDLTGTGTITASTLGVPADITGALYVTGVASSGNVVVGWYNGTVPGGDAIYWLSSESYATAHNLDDYLIAEGVTELGTATGEYVSIDNAVCSANGTQFATRADVEMGTRTIYFAAAPTP